jgi:hypothetical protein
LGRVAGPGVKQVKRAMGPKVQPTPKGSRDETWMSNEFVCSLCVNACLYMLKTKSKRKRGRREENKLKTNKKGRPMAEIQKSFSFTQSCSHKA